MSKTPLSEQLAAWKKQHPKAEEPVPVSRAVHLPPHVKMERPTPSSEAREDALFRSAMGGVAPIAKKKKGAAVQEATRTAEEIDEDAEVHAQLAELVATGDGVDLIGSDGLAQGVDRALLDRLRAGEFIVQARLDLHGLVAEAARAELERFLIDSRKREHRCIQIAGASDVGAWLSRGKLARIVLAFAIVQDALFVLLRK